MASTLGEAVGETVGLRVRLGSKVSGRTRIEVVTEGILTRRIQSDPELSGVGLVIFDEFHERNIHSDLALAFLRDSRHVYREHGLGRIATVSNVTQIGSIKRENAQRLVTLLINVRGRDTAGFVEEAEAKVREQVKFPDGYYHEFGGQFRNLVKAKERLMIVVPLALAFIFVLLFLSFGSVRQAALIFVCVPLAVTGILGKRCISSRCRLSPS